MPRPAAVAVGGYYPLPPHLYAPVASLIDPHPALDSEYQRHDTYALLDPCAGDGAALLGLADRWFNLSRDGRSLDLNLYAVELEGERYEALKERVKDLPGIYQHNYVHTLHGDAFNVSFIPYRDSGAQLLYLNPPYDTDAQHGRLEQAFLARYTDALTPGAGLLVMVVPYHALSASATYLAEQYEHASIHCYRVPDADWPSYHQIVLVARRAAQPMPFGAEDSSAARVIQSWAANPDTIPTLSMSGPPVLAFPPRRQGGGFAQWEMAEFDFADFLPNVRFGTSATKSGASLPSSRLGLDNSLADLTTKPQAVAVPPRPGYIAMAMAARLFNGQRITPDPQWPDLPPLLLKATFTADYRRVKEVRDEKTKKVKQVVEVQQPKLTVTVLDLAAGKYRDLNPSSDPTGVGVTIETMNVADLIECYGISLREVLDKQCPPLHDPKNETGQLPLPKMGRALYHAQEQAVMASIKLMAEGSARPSQNVWLLGEIGSGKTTVTGGIMAMLARQNYDHTQAALRNLDLHLGRVKPVQSVLVLCPPHLLDNWVAETYANLPGARTVVLRSTCDVDSLAQPYTPSDHNLPGAGLTIAILSREEAKLGHEYGVGVVRRGAYSFCPDCGEYVREAEETLIRKRVHCLAVSHRPADPLALSTYRLAHLFSFAHPYTSHLVMAKTAVRQAEKRRSELEKMEPSAQLEWARTTWRRIAGDTSGLPFDATLTGRIIAQLVEEANKRAVGNDTEHLSNLILAILFLFMSTTHPDRDDHLAATVRDLYRRLGGKGSTLRGYVRDMALLFTTVGSEQQWNLIAELRTALVQGISEYDQSNNDYYWSEVQAKLAEMTGADPLKYNKYWSSRETYNKPLDHIRVDDSGRVSYALGSQTLTLGDYMAVNAAIGQLGGAAKWQTSKECGAPLYQATATPRRYPLATYISRHHQRLFQLLVIDESHEYNGDGSAQQIAAGRLVEMGLPVVLLSGSVMSGKARSFFRNMWATSPAFRAEFPYNGIEQFVRRYGYLKRLRDIGDAPAARTDDRSYGSVTDRVDAGGDNLKTIGEAPGVLPVFLMRHLLPMAVTLDRAALNMDIPASSHHPTPLLGPTSLHELYRAAEEKLVREIGRHRKDPEMAGLLLGTLSELPSALDRLTVDTGRGVDDNGNPAFALRYPDSAPANYAGKLVVALPLQSADYLLPKEVWLLKKLESELAEGRRSLIAVWHTSPQSGMVARLQRLIKEKIGEDAVFLDASKVSAGKRQGWIDKEVIGKGRRIMLVNPVAVATGLNNLVWFSNAIWYENPVCSAIYFRQFNGRIDRLRQLLDTRIFFPFIMQTGQEAMFELLLRKVAASLQADGLDWRGAIEAVGGGDDEAGAGQHMAIGEALYNLITDPGQRMGTSLVAQHALAALSHGVNIRVPEPVTSPTPTVRTAMIDLGAYRKGQQLSFFGESAALYLLTATP